MCFDSSPPPATPAPAAAPIAEAKPIPKAKTLRIDTEAVAEQATTKARRKRSVSSLRIDTGTSQQTSGTGLGIG